MHLVSWSTTAHSWLAEKTVQVTVPIVKAEQPQTPVMGGLIDASIWHRIDVEFSLPSLVQVTCRYEGRAADWELVLRKLVRVFIEGETYCPGFQFVPGGSLHPVVVGLFGQAMTLRVPHNYFTAWMLTPSTDLAGSRPVDLLHEAGRLYAALKVFANR